MPSPFAIRAELVDLIRRDLLGPAGGADEELDPFDSRVSKRYLLGALAPGGQQTSTADEPEPEELKAATCAIQIEDSDGRAIDSEPALVDGLLPSSAGFSCLVAPEVTELAISADWGRYERVESAPAEAKKAASVWKRRPCGPAGPLRLPLAAGCDWLWLDEAGMVKLTWRIRKRASAWHVTLFIVNAAPKQNPRRDEDWLFQVRLAAASPDGSAVFLPLPALDGCHELLDPDEREEAEGLALRYRHNLVFARGHGAAARAEGLDGSGRASRIELDFLPVQTVPGQTPRTGSDDPLLADIVLDMQELATMPPEALTENLERLCRAYAVWTEALPGQVAEPGHRQAALQAQAAARRALAHMQEGIAALRDDPCALAAFRFANRAMQLQRVHTVYAELARTTDAQGLAARQELLNAANIPANRSWRLFQLAFLLSHVAGLANPLHPGRSGDHAVAGLLWFSTGGGKTEAYLGLTAFTLAMRRLHPDLGGLDAGHGVGVLMRYTLRLLTLQQFQRAAALICACETLRREDPAQWGSEPFRLGLWVGAKSTPNTLKAAAESIGNSRAGAQGEGSPVQFNSCPWCGSQLRTIVREGASQPGRCFTWCQDADGMCEFTEKRAPDEGLPVMVVDEEIYRRPPSLLIATVDKFARMPWKGETEALFGRVTGYCARHGFITPDTDEEIGAAHNRAGHLPPVKVSEHGWLRPPDLIIQDELHLISGPLGSMTGLYENAVDTLCEWQLDGQTVRPMVIASTATIRRAGEQIRRIFNRAVEVFPPPGVDSRDNFFSLERPVDEANPGRIYLGTCAIGYRIPETMVRVYATVMAAAQYLYNKYQDAADPWMTTIGYFNSIRELAGMNRLIRDEVGSRLAGSYQRGLATRKHIKTEELTSRQASSNIPKILETLANPVQVRENRNGQGGGKKGAKGFYDVVLATNMISVGVDIGRLGLMIVQGQPKNTSEYIQATSRVGRSGAAPGLVLTNYHWTRPRDLSHFEDFYGYHAAFQRHVEALSVMPFAGRALDRGLSAVLVALVRLLRTTLNANLAPKKLADDDTLFQEAKKLLLERAQAIMQDNGRVQEVAEMLEKRRDEWLDLARSHHDVGLAYQKTPTAAGLLVAAGQTHETFACPNSLRDVEKAVNLNLETNPAGLSVAEQ